MALLNSIQDEVWFANKAGKLTLINQAVIEEFGPSILEAKNVGEIAARYEVYLPDGSPRSVDQAPSLRALRGETILKEEEIVRTPATGEFCHRQVSAAPVKDADGGIIGSIAVVRDITDQKKTEARLRSDLNAFMQIHKLSAKLLDIRGLHPLLQEILDAAVEIMAAEKGTLQLLEGDSLRIVAHHAHAKPFIEFFERAENVASVCGEATRRGERVIVPEVEKSPIFLGTPSLQVLRDAGVRAVQSTPILNRKGDLLGILTTQWSIPHSPTEHDLWKLDLLVRQAADLIESVKAEDELRTSERKYRQLFNSMDEGFVLLEPIFDASGKPASYRFLDSNPALTDLTKLKPEALVAKEVRDVLPNIEHHWIEALDRVVLTGRPERIEQFSKDLNGWYDVHIYRPEHGKLALIYTNTTERKRSENALRQLNEQLELRVAERTAELVKSSQLVQAERQRINEMLGCLPAYVILISPDYHVPFANRFFEERFGKSDGKRCFEYLFQRAEPCENCETFKVLKTNSPHRWEWLGPDGRNYDIFDFPFIDSDGSRLIMEVGLDITDRKKAAAELSAERQRLLGVLETLPAMICLLKPDYHVAFANRSFRERFGESEGRYCYEFCFGRSQPCEFCESYSVLKTGKPHHWEVKTADGSVIDVHDFPFADTDGTPLILEMDMDVTQHRRAESALREVGTYNRTLIEASPDPLVTIGPDGRITDVNAATELATGRNRQELVGTDFSEYFSEPDKAKAGYQQVFREGAVRDYPLEIRHLDGRTMPVLYNARVFRNADGKVVGIFAAARDITDRKKAEQELLQAHENLAIRASQLRTLAGELTLSEQRERSRLAKILHDHLQQLLVAAKFRTAVLGRGGDELARQATKEVEDLIDESIAASRDLTAELSPPILHEAGLKAGLQWLARRMTDKQGLFVELEMAEDGDLPHDIKVLLFESVRELLFNVAKHAQTRSATINVRRISDHLQLIVSDQGVGFDPTRMPPTSEGSRGFGLFSIRERLEFVGGTLDIESKPGQGCRIVLSVPLATSTVPEPQPQVITVLPEAQLTGAQNPKQGLRIRVMLVDDHAIVRQGIANLLENEPDIDVVGQAGDGQEAIELVSRLFPDVILMDISMPKLNGVEATRKICSDWPGIRIIGLSMFEGADGAQAMRDAGAVDYISKSGPADILVNVIRKSVQSSTKTSITLGMGNKVDLMNLGKNKI